jgi:hypothetical protein
LVAGEGASPKISYRAVIENDKRLYVAYTQNKLADATAVYPVAKIPHNVVLNAPDEFSTAKISGVSALDSNNEVFTQTEMEARPSDSNFPMIAKLPIDCTIGPFLTKIQFGDDQVLIPSFCFDPGNIYFFKIKAHGCFRSSQQ